MITVDGGQSKSSISSEQPTLFSLSSTRSHIPSRGRLGGGQGLSSGSVLRFCVHVEDILCKWYRG